MIVLGIVILVLGGLFYLSFDIVEKQVDLGFSRSARNNPYLAAKKYLDQQQQPITVIRGYSILDELPGTGDTIIITESRQRLSDSRNSQLIKWLENGGNLIVLAEKTQTISGMEGLFSDDVKHGTVPEDPILRIVGARPYQLIEDESSDSTSPESGDPGLAIHPNAIREQVGNQSLNHCDKGDPGNVNIPVENVEKSLSVYFKGDLRLEDINEEAKVGIGPEEGFTLLQYQVAKGQLTVLTDMTFWRNRAICGNDHALILKVLTEGSDHVWIVFQGDSPSLPAVLWRIAKLLIMTCMIALILLFWRKGYRLGPVLHEENSGSRLLIEHISASSRFLWRKKLSTHMVQQVRQSLEQRLQNKFPNYSKLPLNEKLQLVQRITHLPATDINQAFLEQNTYPKHEFIQTIHSLQKIGKKL